MSEQDLRTMLRDHLSDEPPVNVRSHDAIRAARRGTSRRLALTGAAAVAVLGLSAGFPPGLLADDGSSTARDGAGFSGSADTTYADRVEAVLQEQAAPYAGDLGPADVSVMNVDSETVDPSAPDAQLVGVAHQVSGTEVVSVSVDAFAPEEFAKLQPSDCNPQGWAVSCDSKTLADGSRMTTEVMAYAQTSAGPGVMRVLSPDEVAEHPDRVWWGRSAQTGSPAGMTLLVTEFVKAPTVDDVAWQLPVEALTGMATDPDVLDPTGLAHAPICHSAHNSC
jgi:hypothetical protein